MRAQDFDHLHEVAAMSRHFAQREMLAAQWRIGRGALGIGKALNELGVDGIVLGQGALGFSEITDPGRIGDGHRDAGVLEGQAHLDVVGPRGFTNHVHRGGQFLDLSNEFEVSLLGVWTLPTTALKGDLQRIFGNIYSEVAYWV